MMLKSTIIEFSAICPLSRGRGLGRGLGRGQNVKLKKRRLKKMTTQKYALPKHPKEKHKKQLLPNTFQTACSYQNQAHVV